MRDDTKPQPKAGQDPDDASDLSQAPRREKLDAAAVWTAFWPSGGIRYMDGPDIHEALSRDISLDKLLRFEAKKAAGTDSPLARMRHL